MKKRKDGGAILYLLKSIVEIDEWCAWMCVCDHIFIFTFIYYSFIIVISCISHSSPETNNFAEEYLWFSIVMSAFFVWNIKACVDYFSWARHIDIRQKTPNRLTGLKRDLFFEQFSFRGEWKIEKIRIFLFLQNISWLLHPNNITIQIIIFMHNKYLLWGEDYYYSYSACKNHYFLAYLFPNLFHTAPHMNYPIIFLCDLYIISGEQKDDKLTRATTRTTRRRFVVWSL